METGLIDPELIFDHLAALKRWDLSSNLPDVIDRVDLYSQPEMVSEILRHRAVEHAGPAAPLVGSYPKDDGQTRITCLMDPYDDIHYSILGSSIAAAVESALPCNRVVQRARFGAVGRAFGAEAWRQALRRRGQVITSNGGLSGGFDVRNHYGSIDFRVLERVLHSCGVPDSQCQDLMEFLCSVGAWPMSPGGLLVGPMPSALLGTAVLLPVDRLLTGRGVVFERWMDDIVVCARTSDEFVAIRSEVEELLVRNGQTLNSEKDWYGAKSKFSVGSLVDELAMDTSERSAVNEQALKEAVDNRDARMFRLILGTLRANQDECAIALVVESDALWDLAPRYAADYLLAFNGPLPGDHIERLAQRSIDPPVGQSTAGTAHCARVLGRHRVSPLIGKALFEAAEGVVLGENRMAAPYLYYSSARSTEKAKVRVERAIDTAGLLADLHCGRALIAGLRADTLPRNAAAGLRTLARARNELKPAVALVS